MSEPKWLPAKWLDEVNPELQAEKEAFLFPTSDPAPFIMRPVEDEDEPVWKQEVRIGDIVDFCWHEPHGEFNVANETGQWRADGFWPTSATHFWDYEEIYDSFDALFTDWQGFAIDRHSPFEIAVYTWSDSIPFELTLQDGKPLFVERTKQ